ncbi:MAG: hypothetical protein JWO66_1713 [Candidatus Eremiobacteraeota bacterium]|nr:hypothetical protein [Candidatus Eremiobacteraeota bacterium]
MPHPALHRFVIAALALGIVSVSAVAANAQASPEPSAAPSPLPGPTGPASPGPTPTGPPSMLPAPAAAPAAAASPTSFQSFLHRITITVAPVYLLGTNTDANAVPPPPPGLAGVGYTHDQPVVSGLRVDYGVDFAITDKLHLNASHGNVGYQLGRILTAIPNTAFVTGAMYDYTDTIALNYTGIGHGLQLHTTYFDHQRSVVTGQCLNQKKCLDAAGGVVSNPLSIDEHGWTFGFGLDFGPKTLIGPLFNASADLKYIPRPATPSSPAVALDSLPGYRGTQTLYPWSFTMRLPLTKSPTVIPFINYTSLPVLYRDSAVPEAYRGIVVGISKVFSKNVTFSYTNFNLQSCRCIPRVPAPDNLRLAFGVMKLDLHTQL